MPERLLRKEWWWHKVDVARGIYIVIVILAAITMTITYSILIKQQHRISTEQREIQGERVFSIRRNCEDQNARHENTIKRLNIIIKAYEKTLSNNKTKIKQLQTAKKQNILLIDALAPKQNCNLVVKLATTPRKHGGKPDARSEQQ